MKSKSRSSSVISKMSRENHERGPSHTRVWGLFASGSSTCRTTTGQEPSILPETRPQNRSNCTSRFAFFTSFGPPPELGWTIKIHDSRIHRRLLGRSPTSRRKGWARKVRAQFRRRSEGIKSEPSLWSFVSWPNVGRIGLLCLHCCSWRYSWIGSCFGEQALKPAWGWHWVVPYIIPL